MKKNNVKITSKKNIKQKTIKIQKKQKAFKEDIQKVVDKAKSIILSNKNDNLSKNTEELNNIDDKTSSKKSSEVSMAFFYTNDKYFTQLDDQELILLIQKKYPKFMNDSTNDSDMKKVIVQLLQDKRFVMELLDTFNMNIQEFFKFIFRSNLSIFKGPYLNKLHRILIENKYNI